jgi:hypothetical protein
MVFIASSQCSTGEKEGKKIGVSASGKYHCGISESRDARY